MPTAEPRDRFLVGAELQLGEARKHHPNKGVRIARTEAECLLDMGLGLRAATEKILGETDARVRVGQISIQRQCLLAFSNALGRAVGEHLDDAQKPVGQRMLWSQGQSLDQGRLSRRETRGPVIGQKHGTICRINTRHADQRLDIFGIERQGAFEKAARLRHVLGGPSLVQASHALENTNPSHRDAANAPPAAPQPQ